MVSFFMDKIYLDALKKVVLEMLCDEKTKIILFGSRARKDNYAGSDIDIGLIPSGKIDTTKITLLREKIENMNIPFKVDIINFAETSQDFKQEALKEAVIWKD
jgi:predicted nucleotidyltransferase